MKTIEILSASLRTNFTIRVIPRFAMTCCDTFGECLSRVTGSGTSGSFESSQNASQLEAVLTH